jgi:hypothetical protein
LLLIGLDLLDNRIIVGSALAQIVLKCRLIALTGTYLWAFVSELCVASAHARHKFKRDFPLCILIIQVVKPVKTLH